MASMEQHKGRVWDNQTGEAWTAADSAAVRAHERASALEAAVGRGDRWLRDLLLRYGGHAYDCAAPGGSGARCDCGWEAVRAVLSEDQRHA